MSRDHRNVDWMASVEATDGVEALLTLRNDLVREVQGIDAQLTDRNKIDPSTGQRMDDRAWWAWRSRAVMAKKHLNDALRRCNEKRKAASRTRHFTGPDVGSLAEAASRAMQLLWKLARENQGTDPPFFDAEEQAIVDGLRDALKQAGVNPNMVAVPWRPAGD